MCKRKLIINKVLKMLRKIVLFMTLMFISFLNIYGQQERPNRNLVVGQVVEEENEDPIPYATIFIKGANKQVLTDDKGQFAIQANKNNVLIVSYIGFESKEVHVTSHNVKIYLKKAAYELDEVQVVGTALGLKRPAKELGYSATIINNAKLTEGSPTNTLTGLSSKVAGLRINMYDSKVDPDFKVVLRGYRSLTGNNEPIYVVDGMPIPNINRLNPNDIESITVLKGANAAALYGSEGVNGALIITTKSGENGKGKVEYRNSTMFSSVFLLPKAQNSFGQGIDGVYDPTTSQSWGPAFDGTMKNFGTVLPNGEQPKVLYAAPSHDVRKDLFQTGVNVQHDISFSKATNRASYFTSLQTMQIDGIIPHDKSTRYSGRFNTTQNFGNLTLATSINFSNTNSNTAPDGPWPSLYVLPANYPLDEMKNWKDENSLGNPNNYFVSGVSGLQLNSPYYYIDTHRDKSRQQVLNGKIEAEYTFFPWLKAMARIGLYNSDTQTHSSITKYDTYVSGRNQSGSVSDGSTLVRRINGDFIIRANQKWGKFAVNGIVGENIRDDYAKSMNLSAANLLFSNIENPDSRSGDLTGATNISRQRQVALYGEVTGGYNDYLFLTVTGRNDWVSVLSKQNRSFFYPGISTSFVFSNAFDFLKESKVFSFGKIYAAYNKTGNVSGITPYALNLSYSQATNFPYNNLVGYVPASQKPNTNIKPEFVHSFEIGTQLSFFDRRLNAEIAYSYSNSKGQIFQASTSAATGYTSTLINMGELSNNVLEVSLSGDILRSKNWRWNLALNYSYIKNKVNDLYGTDDTEEYNIFKVLYAVKGESFPSVKVTDYNRNPQGRIIVDAKTGLPSKAVALTTKGSSVPPHLFGLQSSISYKSFSLYFDFDCRLGGWNNSEFINSMIKAGTHPMTTEYNRKEYIIPNSVIQQTNADGTKTYIENTSVYAKGSDKASYWSSYVAGYTINYTEKSDYLKLKTLSLSYNVPHSILKRLAIISDATISVQATNLFIIRHKGYDAGDPENLYYNEGFNGWRQQPPYRTYGFTLDVTF